MAMRLGSSWEDGFCKPAEKLGFGDRKRLKREDVFEVEQIRECISFGQDDGHYHQWY